MLEAGHRELETEIPDPLEASGFRRLWTLSLPAVALSAASAVVFVLVPAFLMHDREMQELFVLPGRTGLALALVAALLAWGIVLTCRRRPGRPWPRWWCLFLALVNTALCILGLRIQESSVLDALSVAGLAAAVTLVPRLVKLRPDSSWVQLIAPLSFLGVLLVVLPAVAWTGQRTVNAKRACVEEAIAQLRRWTTEVQEVSRLGWARLEADPDAVGKVVDRLELVQPQGLLANARLWHEAAILGRDGELAAAAAGLADAAVVGLHPDQVPRVSTFQEPAVFWSTSSRRWETGLAFPPASEVAGRYHQQIGRIFDEVEPEGSPPTSRAWIDLKQHCSDAKETLRQQLRSQEGTWTDGWAVYRVPSHKELLGRSEIPLVDLLQTSMAGGDEGLLRPADLPNLMRVTLHEVETQRRLQGCRDTGRYFNGSYQHFRIDCYAYLPQKRGLGAELRVEMRLVYAAGCRYCTLRYSQYPEEVYFLFPIPDDVDSKQYERKVMIDLMNAVRAVSSVPVSVWDLSGSAENGFRIGDIRVNRSRPEELPGGQRALVVRAVRG